MIENGTPRISPTGTLKSSGIGMRLLMFRPWLVAPAISIRNPAIPPMRSSARRTAPPEISRWKRAVGLLMSSVAAPTIRMPPLS